jgi:hypothetical protein
MRGKAYSIITSTSLGLSTETTLKLSKNIIQHGYFEEIKHLRYIKPLHLSGEARSASTTNMNKFWSNA